MADPGRPFTIDAAVQILDDSTGKGLAIAHHALNFLLILSPIALGPAAIPLLGLLPVTDELATIGGKLLAGLRRKKDADYVANLQRLRAAHAVLVVVAASKSLSATHRDVCRRLGLEDGRGCSLEYVEGQLRLAAEQTMPSPLRDLDLDVPGALGEPDEVDSGVERAFLAVRDAYSDVIQRSDDYLGSDDTTRASALEPIDGLETRAREEYVAGYVKLAGRFPEFYIWRQYVATTQMAAAVAQTRSFLDQYEQELRRSAERADQGFGGLEKILVDLPARGRAAQADEVLELLERNARADLERPIIDIA
jgi:hypothetical protein